MKYTRVTETAMALLLTLCLCISCFSFAAAEEAFQINTTELEPLSNKKLAKLANAYLGKGYTLYQPNSRETYTNMSSAEALDEFYSYALLAVKGQDVRLLMLQKKNDTWSITNCNDVALQRPGFTLVNFSTDGGGGSNSTVNFYFYYLDEKERGWELLLYLSDIYPCYFSALSTPSIDSTINYRDFYFSSDGRITYQVDYSEYQCMYRINLGSDVSFLFDDFSFAQCPITIQDLLSPVDIQNKSVRLFMYPDLNTEPIFEIMDNETLNVVQQNGRHRKEWTLAYYGDGLFYIPTSDLIDN